MDASSDLAMFPPLEARQTGMLPVDDLHTLYWEESGNPQGIPVVYVHGGLAGGSSPDKRQWFDPDAYRIILFDQRAAIGAIDATGAAYLAPSTTWFHATRASPHQNNRSLR